MQRVRIRRPAHTSSTLHHSACHHIASIAKHYRMHGMTHVNASSVGRSGGRRWLHAPCVHCLISRQTCTCISTFAYLQVASVHTCQISASHVYTVHLMHVACPRRSCPTAVRRGPTPASSLGPLRHDCVDICLGEWVRVGLCVCTMGRRGVVYFGMLKLVSVCGGVSAVGSASAGCGLGALCCLLGTFPSCSVCSRCSPPRHLRPSDTSF